MQTTVDTLRIIITQSVTTTEDMDDLRSKAGKIAEQKCAERGLAAVNLDLVDKRHWREARHAEWAGTAFDDMPTDADVYVYCFQAEARHP